MDPATYYLFNHVFLPARLPHRDDRGNGSGDRALVEWLLKAARRFRDLNDPQHYQNWTTIIRMLRSFDSLHQHDDTFSKETLKTAIRDVRHGNIVVLHVNMQNSCLMICKRSKDYIIESFEASPLAAKVLASSAALQWDFPSRAVIVCEDTFEDLNFEASFTEFMEKAYIEPVQQYAAIIRKAKAATYENRDTATPAIIGRLLMAVLEANGHYHAPNMTRKRVRDEVNWNDGAEKPWRRSPTWLVLRVALQRSLGLLFGDSMGTLQYKFFLAFFMSSLLEDFCGDRSFPWDQLGFARSKVARRLYKLQQQSSAPCRSVQTEDRMWSIYGRCFNKALCDVNQRLQSAWQRARQSSTHRISLLPQRAPRQSTRLSLYHSRTFLSSILQDAAYERSLTRVQLQERHQIAEQVTGWMKINSRKVHSVLDYFCLAEFEKSIRLGMKQSPGADTHGLLGMDHECVNLAQNVHQYQELALPAYRGAPEQLSLMILLMLELWQTLDNLALKLYPLLSKYDPGFPHDLLDPLQILEMKDMRRVQNVQDYLEKRHSTAESAFAPIFDGISQSSFAVQYFDQCSDMQNLMNSINHDNEIMRASKLAEWTTLSEQHSEHLQEAARTPCLFVTNAEDPLGPLVHDGKRCRKHYLQRVAKRMSIDVHEALLPSNVDQAKAVVFELLLPRGFASWRDATWQILHLARTYKSSRKKPAGYLRDFPALRRYGNPSSSSLMLASEKKAFQNTHYVTLQFPLASNKVCVPHGQEYHLYDKRRELWTSRRPVSTTFAQLCAASIPQDSVYTVVRECVYPLFPNTRSSTNETLASQTRCPNSLTISDFTAFQDLRLGVDLPWIRLLREFGSSNLDFGALEVRVLVTQLALMAGPRKGRSVLRAHHWVFEDQQFCMAMLAQIHRRLQDIAANWRENQTAACMTTLLQRIWSLAYSADVVAEAESLLMYVRKITYKWTRLLRQEICNASNIETMQRRSKDVFVAAMISRKTYIIEVVRQERIMQADALTSFLECGFVIKENLNKSEADYISNMPSHQKQFFLADIKIVHVLESRLTLSMQALPAAVSEAVNNVWAFAGAQTIREFTPWTCLSDSHRGWFTANSCKAWGIMQQTVHIDILEGTLLIDGQPLGRLPEEYTKQEFFQRLFGSQVFMTYPSNMPGMSYMLASPFRGHEVHFGYRNGYLFVRARFMGRRLEWIPSNTFLGPAATGALDLPLPLVSGHAHWLDLDAQILEVRPLDSMWQAKKGNWTIDLRTNLARRRDQFLVDPCSDLCRQLAQIIEPFEERSWMTVFQGKKNLVLRLPQLELSFIVNDSGSLESRQLRAIVDENQDAGTLYGLNSRLVIRDLKVPENRSVIVAMSKGPAMIIPNRDVGHVDVKISHAGFYARFNINNELGRLECAAEPRLLYFKAYCHAITTSVMPEPLTGRTGAEEAIRCLQAGSSQPWAPIDTECQQLLLAISELTPQRSYYPENLKFLQRITWKEDMIPAAQHDLFLPLVTSILSQSTLLSKFHQGAEDPLQMKETPDHHLVSRALSRNQLYSARQSGSESPIPPDSMYTARDCEASVGANNAFEASLVLKNGTRNVAVSRDFCSVLQSWPVIQGFRHTFDLGLLSEWINVEFATNWGSLFKLCQSACLPEDKYKLMFILATMAFGGGNMDVIRSFIAISIIEESRSLRLPTGAVFTSFKRFESPTIESIVGLVQPYRTPYPGDERTSKSDVKTNLRQRQELELARKTHENQSNVECKALAHHLLHQWPSRELSLDDMVELPLLNSDKALLAVLPDWERLSDNYELSEHLAQVQKILDKCKAATVSDVLTAVDPKRAQLEIPASSNQLPSMTDSLTEVLRTPQGVDSTRSLQELLDYTEVEALVQKPLPSRPSLRARDEIVEVIPKLSDLVNSFASSDDPVRNGYGKYLEGSLNALQQHRSPCNTNASGIDYFIGYRIDHTRLDSFICATGALMKDFMCKLSDTVNNKYPWLGLGGLLPRMTPITLMEVLPSLTANQTHSPTSALVICFAKLLARLQHLLRVRGASKRADNIYLANELRTQKRGIWQSGDPIEWLLLQIDFDFKIRDDQYEVAQAMVATHTSRNFVLQMNMGQGKSSVIIPMVVAQLANGQNLARVVVPRPLLLQMAQLLQGRLGGLVGRIVKHVPFSRRSSTAMYNLQTYESIHHGVLAARGVILTLPEHILSFKLSGLQEMSYGHVQEAAFMMELQDWFGGVCRDLLDECDHMLAVKTQLIYPSGSQSMVDGHPFRWTVVQDLLGLVKLNLRQLKADYPQSIGVIERGPGAFPTVHLLDSDVKDALIQRLTESVVNGEAGTILLNGQSEETTGLIESFLRYATFKKSVAGKIASVLGNEKESRNRLLLCRGLLVHRILLMGLGKRWNVQFGIHPSRDPIAVPFISKGVPSDQAEFGHPDVSILLTCLSFYYSGLTFPQFSQSMSHLLKFDEPAQEYDLWMRDIGRFPDSLRSWRSINVDDGVQLSQLWNLLRYQMVVVNFFLNHFVFPRFAKTFQRKLVSSGWDIPMIADESAGEPSASSSNCVTPSRNSVEGCNSRTVGFSGTNDNRTLLPLNVLQNDLPGLAHTNAEVLTYLLQTRNQRYYAAAGIDGKRLSERAFLEKLNDQSIRMLLDAGALVLELDNKSLAETWLSVDFEAEAAVFFDADDRARVLYRDGKSQPLVASPYMDNLGSCLVYLDEAHTRGVDLKMPPEATAALTLGIMQTKDHTVQAAMRLRQLAISQSVVFFAPPEVHQSILNFRRKTKNDTIDSFDVITWLLEQTCCNIEQLQPLYISQGLEYCRRYLAADKYRNAPSSKKQRHDYLRVLEQPEQFSLEKLYAPDQTTRPQRVNASGNQTISTFIDKLETLKSTMRNTGDAVQALAHQEVEQEREIQVEVETVRELKKPNHASALRPNALHSHVLSFVTTGRLVAASSAYQQAFVVLRHTALGRRLGISSSACDSQIYVTKDFNDTVASEPEKPRRDEYSRPVHWILWSDVSQTALICSDFEADKVLPYLRNSKVLTRTHLIVYSAPVSKGMLIFDTLKFYAIPSLPEKWRAPAWLVRDLGIFAGRLYFNFEDQHSPVCATLGLPLPSSVSDQDPTICKQEPFSPSPLLFMQEWLAIRRKGQDFSQTMMGQLCRGRRLEQEDALDESQELIEDPMISGDTVEDVIVDDDDGDGNEEDGGFDDDE